MRTKPKQPKLTWYEWADVTGVHPGYLAGADAPGINRDAYIAWLADVTPTAWLARVS